jgi:ParB family transcriptional regulator, chromosome partitioning protein
MAKKALGKGLMALLDDNIKDEVLNKSKIKEEINNRKLEIPLSKIKPNDNQPRKIFEDTDELRDSIREKGILQPILVRKMEDHFQIIAGERRYRAAKELKLKEIPVIVLDTGEQETLEIALIENIQRKNLNPVEEANGYKMLIERFSLTQEEVAQRVGKERSTVTNLMRLLGLPQKILDDIARGILSTGHAKVLLSLDDPKEQLKWRGKINKKALSGRAVEKMLQARLAGKTNSKKIHHSDVFLKDLENTMEEYFGTKVKISGTHKKGRIFIEYYNLDDLERIQKKVERSLR